MNILVTGGAGFIGSQTVRHLIEKGFNPIVFDNLYSGFQDSVPDGCIFEFGDIRNRGELDHLFKKYKISAVIHLAALIVVHESILESQNYYDVNIIGTQNLIQLCHQYDVKNFVFASSSTVYGNQKSFDVKQQNTFFLHEQDAVSPLSPYGATKLEAESILKNNFHLNGLNSISLRFFNIAGAAFDLQNGQRRKKVTHLIHAVSVAACAESKKINVFGRDYLTPDGTCIRDYLHLQDAAEALVLSVQFLFNHSGSFVFNCGSGVGFSVLEIIERFQKINNIELEVTYQQKRQGDPTALIANINQIQHVLKWKPKYSDLDRICRTAFLWQSKMKELFLTDSC